MADTTAIVNRLRFLSNGLTPLAESNVMREAAAEIERLRAQRDAARRMYCKFVARNEPEYIAERWGWDCFKENTND